MFFDPGRLGPWDGSYRDNVLVVLPAEWAALHQRDGEPPSETALSEISEEIERLHPEIRVTLLFERTPEERESGQALRCFIDPVGRARQFLLGHPYEGLHGRFGALADSITGVTRSYYQRVINPAD